MVSPRFGLMNSSLRHAFSANDLISGSHRKMWRREVRWGELGADWRRVLVLVRGRLAVVAVVVECGWVKEARDENGDPVYLARAVRVAEKALDNGPGGRVRLFGVEWEVE